jgi:hypothetical protein
MPPTRLHPMRDGRYLRALDVSTELLFWLKVDGDDYHSCWTWMGCRETASGYGAFTPTTGVTVKAHRFAYESMVGPIPEGLHLDHLCRTRLCVNPWHLEPVTPQVNTWRGMGHGKETQCPQGHPYDTENTYHYRGRRYCRPCKRAHQAAFYERQRNATEDVA